MSNRAAAVRIGWDARHLAHALMGTPELDKSRDVTPQSGPAVMPSIGSRASPNGRDMASRLSCLACGDAHARCRLLADGVDKVADEMGEALQLTFGRAALIPFSAAHWRKLVSFARAPNA